VRKGFRKPAISCSRPLLRVWVSALISTQPGLIFRRIIEDVVNLLRWEDLADVIVCGHSYGGIVISGVADRVPERIRSLFYLDAFVPENGESLFDIHPPGLAERMRILAQTAGDGWNVPPIPAERSNINPRGAAWVDRQCTSQSIATFEEHIKLNRMSSRTHDATYICATGWDNSPFRRRTIAQRRKDGTLARLPVDTR
jgi:pimeloyl-ACP methyl ester carboxylesterase